MKRRLLKKNNTYTIFPHNSEINLFFLNLEIKSINMTTLYDTGAEFSLMSYQTFKEITKDETQILNYQKGIIKTMNSENRHTLKIIGSCKFNATIHTTCNISIEIPVTFMITKESPIIPVIIGMNTIIRNRIADILHNKILRIQGHDVNLQEHSRLVYENLEKTSN